MVKLRPYRPGDLDVIQRRPQDYSCDEMDEQTKLLGEIDVSFTIEVDGVPVALFGVQKLWTGVAHAWSIISDDVRGHGLTLTKTCHKMIDDYAEANGIWRVQVTVQSDLTENKRWVEAMGFAYESTQKCASPDGKDLDTFVRFYHGRINT